jgi:hypothetical protein
MTMTMALGKDWGCQQPVSGEELEVWVVRVVGGRAHSERLGRTRRERRKPEQKR